MSVVKYFLLILNPMGIPVISDSRTFVPVRYVVEMLGAIVEWDGLNQAVYIYSNKYDDG